MQVPPAYSAIRLNGQRASEMARAGVIPEMKKRPVNIYKLELLNWDPPFADIFVHCSSGTYIRSLARDIALAAGSRAHLYALERTHVAGFKLEVKNEQSNLRVAAISKDVISILGLPWFEVTSQEAKEIFHGKPLEPIIQGKSINAPALLTAAVFYEDTVIAIVEKTSDKWKYGCVFQI
jgi:tRNA pseudouridine55 synthase